MSIGVQQASVAPSSGLGNQTGVYTSLPIQIWVQGGGGGAKGRAGNNSPIYYSACGGGGGLIQLLDLKYTVDRGVVALYYGCNSPDEILTYNSSLDLTLQVGSGGAGGAWNNTNATTSNRGFAGAAGTFSRVTFPNGWTSNHERCRP